MHQTSTDHVELPLEGRGEAPRGKRSGDADAAMGSTGRSGDGDSRLMERVVERGNLLCALKRVQQIRGAPGWMAGRWTICPLICATTGGRSGSSY